LHGFDEVFGYLYHLDAMSDIYWFDYPQDWIDKTGPRNLTHCWATDKDDSTDMPRWGVVGKQKIEDAGPLAPFPDMKDMQGWQKGRTAKYDMETFDEVLVGNTTGAMDKAKKDGKPFFIWHNTTRMHIFTDNGAEVFTWPDGGMTPFKGTKGTAFEGGFRVPAIIRWPGHIKPGSVENGIFSGLDWFPTLVAAAGNPDITNQLLKGVKLGDRTYKNHLDGYNQMAVLTGTGPSVRHELFYFAGPHLGALRVDDFKFQFIQQPYGWPGEKLETDMPTMTNIRQDPFERTSTLRGETFNTGAGGYMMDFMAREFWRFVNVQMYVGKAAQSAIEFPPMQDPASFNLDAIKAKIAAAIKARESQ
jgi:arylsulfatase